MNSNFPFNNTLGLIDGRTFDNIWYSKELFQYSIYHNFGKIRKISMHKTSHARVMHLGRLENKKLKTIQNEFISQKPNRKMNIISEH